MSTLLFGFSNVVHSTSSGARLSRAYLRPRKNMRRRRASTRFWYSLMASPGRNLRSCPLTTPSSLRSYFGFSRASVQSILQYSLIREIDHTIIIEIVFSKKCVPALCSVGTDVASDTVAPTGPSAGNGNGRGGLNVGLKGCKDFGACRISSDLRSCETSIIIISFHLCKRRILPLLGFAVPLLLVAFAKVVRHRPIKV